MKLRMGRLRLAEVVMAPLAVGVVVIACIGEWDSNGDGFGFIRLLTLLIGGVGVLSVVQAVSRTSPAGAIACDVALCVACPVVFIILLISELTSDTADGSVQSLAQIGIVGLFITAVWGIRSESRGFKPDPGAHVESLPAPKKQPSAAGG